MRSLLAAALAATLFGCAPQLRGFTAGDFANAAALAQTGGDTAAAACWGGLGGAVAATPDPQSDGLAVPAERKRLADAAVAGPCAPVVGPMLLELLARVTPAPFSLLVP
jgi:hypothetical protein